MTRVAPVADNMVVVADMVALGRCAVVVVGTVTLALSLATWTIHSPTIAHKKGEIVSSGL